MLDTKHPFKLTSFQVNLISLLVVGTVIAVLLVIGIGYRSSRIGLFAVGGMMAAGLAGVIFFRPQIGTYVLVVTIITNVSAILTDMGLPGVNKPLVALTFVSVMAARLSRHRSFELKRVEWFMLAYGGAWLASAFVASDRGLGIEHVIDFVKDFVILLCIVYSLESRDSWKRAIWLIILSTTFLATLSTYQVITGNYGQIFWGLATVTPDVTQMRLSGPLGDPNFYSQILAAVLPLALYRILNEQKLALKLVAGGSALLLVFTILNSYSRGAFLAMLLTMLLIAIERRVKFSLILLVVLSTFVMMQFLPEGYTERMETLTAFTNKESKGVHEDASFRGRSSEMISGILMFADHPFLGIGIGNYEINYQDYAMRLGLEHRTEDRQAHSLYLEMAAETGLLGLVTFVGLFGSLLIGFIKARRKSKSLDKDPDWSIWLTSLQMSLSSYLVTSIFLHGDYIRYLFLFVTMGAAAIRLSDSNVKSVQSQLL